MHHDILTIAVSAVTAISAVALMEWMFGRTYRVCGWLDVSVIVHVLSFAMLGFSFVYYAWIFYSRNGIAAVALAFGLPTAVSAVASGNDHHDDWVPY